MAFESHIASMELGVRRAAVAGGSLRLFFEHGVADAAHTIMFVHIWLLESHIASVELGVRSDAVAEESLRMFFEHILADAAHTFVVCPRSIYFLCFMFVQFWLLDK